MCVVGPSNARSFSPTDIQHPTGSSGFDRSRTHHRPHGGADRSGGGTLPACCARRRWPGGPSARRASSHIIRPPCVMKARRVIPRDRGSSTKEQTNRRREGFFFCHYLLLLLLLLLFFLFGGSSSSSSCLLVVPPAAGSVCVRLGALGGRGRWIGCCTIRPPNGRICLLPRPYINTRTRRKQPIATQTSAPRDHPPNPPNPRVFSSENSGKPPLALFICTEIYKTAPP